MSQENENKALVVIPARIGSKGVRNKNFRAFGSSSLVERTIKHSLCFVSFADIVVSTDNLEFISRILGQKPDCALPSDTFVTKDGLIFHIRPSFLAQDDSLISELIRHLIGQLRKEGKIYQSVILLQPTTPFRSLTELTSIKNLIESSNFEIESLVSFRKVEDSHPARMYEMNDDNTFKLLDIYREFQFSPRQSLPPLFLRDGGYYVMSNSLIQNLAPVGVNPQGIVRDFPYCINVDSEEDFKLAEDLIDYKLDDPNEMV